jgi:hypothetical protein
MLQDFQRQAIGLRGGIIINAGQAVAKCILDPIQNQTAIHAVRKNGVPAAVSAWTLNEITQVVVELLGQRLTVLHGVFLSFSPL